MVGLGSEISQRIPLWTDAMMMFKLVNLTNNLEFLNKCFRYLLLESSK